MMVHLPFKIKTNCYSLSDSSLATAFSIFVTKRLNLPSKLGKYLRVCINKLFVSTPKNVDFAH